jgi:hypothetical protein
MSSNSHPTAPNWWPILSDSQSEPYARQAQCGPQVPKLREGIEGQTESSPASWLRDYAASVRLAEPQALVVTTELGEEQLRDRRGSPRRARIANTVTTPYGCGLAGSSIVRRPQQRC